jgi:ABC-2 type transport system permease protein
VLPAIVGYTLRACMPRGRRIGLVLLGAVGVLFGLLAQTTSDPPAYAFAEVAGIALFALVVPLACLVIGDAVLGAELRGGTLHFTWLSPVPFAVIVVGRWLGGLMVATMVLVPTAIGSALVAGTPESAAATAVAAVAGAAAYLALFVAIGCLVRRAAMWSLTVVFLGERLLGAALSGIAQISPGWVARNAFADLAPDADHLLREGVPSGTGALVRLAIITVVLLAVASWRLGHLRLSGDAD